MAVKIKRGQALGMLSLTPLIDVVFLLLIFFLVATRFAQEDRELDVVLPSASEARPLIVQPRELFVNIDRQGNYFIDGKTLNGEEVEAVLRQAVANNPVNQSVIIRADKRVQLDHAVLVMNLCNKVGILDYKLTIDGENR
jgi:biopolymer transport protein ExbD